MRTRKPNSDDFMDNVTMHSVEHMFATLVRNSEIGGDVIYFGPMGCRTGFYLTVWQSPDVSIVKDAVLKALSDVVKADGIPAENPVQCGNFRLHSLALAKEYAQEILRQGFNENYIIG